MRLHNFQEGVLLQVDQLMDRHLQSRFEGIAQELGVENFFKAIRYSIFPGGKRFRPLLAAAITHTLGGEIPVVIPWASAVEMIHGYSLVHDDLPCIDDDDQRRGQPSTHSKFGEATALLAGDALLTESFLLLASSLRDQPEIAGLMVALLAQAAGVHGMIGGQVMDLESQKIPMHITQTQLETLHRLKTGALIRVAAQGAAILCSASDRQIDISAQLGEHLGLAFQIADDLLDHVEEAPESGSFPAVVGILQSQQRLQKATQSALECAAELGDKSGILTELIHFNLSRDT